MDNYKNITIDDIELLNEEHKANLEVVSLNLDDYNERFGTDINLLYSVEDYEYYSMVPSELAEIFIVSISDLLFMANNPSNDDITFWNEFVSWKLIEVTNKSIYKIWFTDYYPLGIELSNEVKNYIINDFNQSILTL
ncbi:hypothetical protein ACTS9U_07140 [Empedobacter falsenii]|nr:hypothetical protein [Flavobacteriaceae bacterium]